MCIFRDVLGMDQSTTTYWDSIQLWKPSIELCGTCWKWFSQIYFCREEQHSNQKNILKSLTGTITQRNERERERRRETMVFCWIRVVILVCEPLGFWRLPYFEEANTAMGLVLKSFLVEQNTDLKQRFPNCTNPIDDLKRGIQFWDEVNESNTNNLSNHSILSEFKNECVIWANLCKIHNDMFELLTSFVGDENDWIFKSRKRRNASKTTLYRF